MTISGVSVSGISSSAAYQPNATQTHFGQARQDFKDLASALQSGDLSGAQTAFAAWQQVMQSGQAGTQQNASQNGGKQNQFAQDMAAVGKALQSGDVAGAKQAFAQLQQDMQSAGRMHHRHHSHGSGNSASGADSGVEALLGSSAPSTDTTGDTVGSVGSAPSVDVSA
ncbi:MAG TPA: hypothetical protein VMJ74_13165 [Pseudomonadales bacterium]|nr:hypothetical protein [Pseudomonadales bacterium]